MLIGAIVFILIALAITTLLIKQQQDNRQRASGNETPAATPSATLTPTPKETMLDSEEWAFLTLINNHRQSMNLAPLKASKTLTDAAHWMANDMASRNTLSHQDSLGRMPSARCTYFLYPQQCAENAAQVYASAQSAYDGFYNACDGDANNQNCTYDHRHNMENPSWRAIGIGRAQGTTNWFWTTDFGTIVDQEITPTPTPSVTDTPTPTQTPTATQIPTATTSPTATTTPTNTTTPTPTSTPTLTPTPTSIPTPTNTPVQSATPTSFATQTPTVSPSPTASLTLTTIPLTATATSMPPTATPTIAKPGGMTQTIGIIGGALIVILGGIFLLVL